MVLTFPMTLGAIVSSVLFFFNSKDCSHPLGSLTLACYLLGVLSCFINIMVKDKLVNKGLLHMFLTGFSVLCWIGSVALYLLAAHAFFKIRELTPACRIWLISIIDGVVFLFGLVFVLGYFLFAWYIIIRNSLEASLRKQARH